MRLVLRKRLLKTYHQSFTALTTLGTKLWRTFINFMYARLCSQIAEIRKNIRQAQKYRLNFACNRLS